MVIHTLIKLKSLYSVNRRLADEDELMNGHARLDLLIRAYAEDERLGSTTADWVTKTVLFPGTSHQEEIVLTKGGISTDFADLLNWSLHSEFHSCTHYNFALAARLLWIACFRQMLDEQYRTANDRHCVHFHRQWIAMLNWLQIKAWSELHATVMLTIGCLLPAELAQLVFLHALDTESLPDHPTVYETIKVEPPESLLMFEEFEGLTPRSTKQVKEKYRCPNSVYKDPLSVFDHELEQARLASRSFKTKTNLINSVYKDPSSVFDHEM